MSTGGIGIGTAASADARRRWLVLATMTGSLSMIMIDQTVVSVALPTMQRDLGLTQTNVQWVVNAYMLALAALVAVGGRLGDLLGQARMFKLGAIVFITASALCGLAGADWQIIGARTVQGIGAAATVPASQAIVTNTFDVSERGKAMGVYSGISMVFLALGPLVGGILTEDVTWRAVFWINVPVGLAMLAAAHFTVRNAHVAGGHMDWLGAALLVPGLGGLVLGLMQGQAWGWGSPAVLASLAVGVVLLVAFVITATRVTDALIDMRIFRSRNFSADSLVMALVQFGLTGLTVFGALWTQDVLGFGPITTGLAMLPLTIPLLVVSPLAGRLYDRVGARALVAGGALLVAAAFTWDGLQLHKIDYGWLWPGYVMLGVGIGMVMTPANTDALNTAPAALRGSASGVVQAVRQIGGTVGLAIMGTIVATIEQHRIDDFVAGVAAGDPHRAAATGHMLGQLQSGNRSVLHQLPPAAVHAARIAETTAISTSYYVVAGFLVAGAVVAMLVLRRTVDAERASVASEPRPSAVG
ncbi:MAG TPA: DHA2 family efflux MFS transporter permease subunit [Solirubrobacteraceae bacterium]|nr:DHA2 family efflux MFS transporter permease subunit [Solirubrobacteraceae bacterium]